MIPAKSEVLYFVRENELQETKSGRRMILHVSDADII